jgi:hypothetical protein
MKKGRTVEDILNNHEWAREIGVQDVINYINNKPSTPSSTRSSRSTRTTSSLMSVPSIGSSILSSTPTVSFSQAEFLQLKEQNERLTNEITVIKEQLITITQLLSNKNLPQSIIVSHSETDPETSHSETDPETSHSETDPETSHSETDPETSHSETDPETSQPETNPETYQPETDPETYQPETNPETYQPETDPETSQPETNPETSQPETNPETSHSETDPETSQSETDPETSQPETNPEPSQTETDPETSQSETVSEVSQTNSEFSLPVYEVSQTNSELSLPVYEVTQTKLSQPAPGSELSKIEYELSKPDPDTYHIEANSLLSLSDDDFVNETSYQSEDEQVLIKSEVNASHQEPTLSVQNESVVVQSKPEVVEVYSNNNNYKSLLAKIGITYDSPKQDISEPITTYGMNVVNECVVKNKTNLKSVSFSEDTIDRKNNLFYTNGRFDNAKYENFIREKKSKQEKEDLDGSKYPQPPSLSGLSNANKDEYSDEDEDEEDDDTFPEDKPPKSSLKKSTAYNKKSKIPVLRAPQAPAIPGLPDARKNSTNDKPFEPKKKGSTNKSVKNNLSSSDKTTKPEEKTTWKPIQLHWF